MQVIALLAPIGSGVASGVLQKRAAAGARLPLVSIATGLLVATMLVIQLRNPFLLVYLARSPALLAEGQIWRAVTALFVQDGGLAGGLFNLMLLAAIGPLAENRIGPRHWAIAYFGGGVVTEFAALAWQPHGAGNSIACFALAGTLVMTNLAQRRNWLSLASALVGFASAFVLLAHLDIHGIGFLAGTAIGIILVWLRQRRVTEIAS